MTRAVLARLAWMVVVTWFVVTATFAMLIAIPADPARTLLGPHATAEAVVAVRAHYCLDDGALGQYGCWLERIAHGDLGHSYRTKRPVAEILSDRLWPTAQLALATLVLQLLIGVPLGVLAAVRRGRWPDRGATLVGLLGQSAPPFVVGTLLLYVFAYRFGWFPIAGYGEAGWDRLHHVILPAMTSAAMGIAYYARVVRTELADTLDADHVRTARAKGLSEPAVVVRHALRGSLGSVVTLLGVDLGVLLGGTVVTETIFAWPGLGRTAMLAIADVDIPVILGVVLVASVAVAVANMLADVACLWLDPRLRD